jgi:hypothetical protein
MCFADDSLLPGNPAPLMITAAPCRCGCRAIVPPSNIFPSHGKSKPRSRWVAITQAGRSFTSTCATPRLATSRKTFRSTPIRFGHFASRTPEAPESKVARKKLRDFVRRHLKEDACAPPA